MTVKCSWGQAQPGISKIMCSRSAKEAAVQEALNRAGDVAVIKDRNEKENSFGGNAGLLHDGSEGAEKRYGFQETKT
jgi:c-di-AMP phosphodiesterase-like protein